jgi:hypothetical protein
MAEWWSIEVFSSDKLPASRWRYAYEDELTEAVITHGALYYEWHDTQYGVILEALFSDDGEFREFCALPAVRAALDGVPDPVNGLLIYRGRGGASGGGKPRRPKPAPGAAALEAEEPRRRVRLPRKRANRLSEAELDTLIQELKESMQKPSAEPGPPSEPLRVEPDPGDPVWRNIA